MSHNVAICLCACAGQGSACCVPQSHCPTGGGFPGVRHCAALPPTTSILCGPGKMHAIHTSHLYGKYTCVGREILYELCTKLCVTLPAQYL